MDRVGDVTDARAAHVMIDGSAEVRKKQQTKLIANITANVTSITGCANEYDAQIAQQVRKSHNVSANRTQIRKYITNLQVAQWIRKSHSESINRITEHKFHSGSANTYL